MLFCEEDPGSIVVLLKWDFNGKQLHISVGVELRGRWGGTRDMRHMLFKLNASKHRRWVIKLRVWECEKGDTYSARTEKFVHFLEVAGIRTRRNSSPKLLGSPHRALPLQHTSWALSIMGIWQEQQYSNNAVMAMWSAWSCRRRRSFWPPGPKLSSAVQATFFTNDCPFACLRMLKKFRLTFAPYFIFTLD